MYSKTKVSGLALALVFLLGALTILTPKSIYAAGDDTNKETTATVTFEAGTLSLVNVATFDFGEQEIAAASETYSAISVDPAIRVSDLRGNGSGWDLNVALSEFLHEESSKELSGAFLTLTGTSISGINGTLSNAPTSTSTESLVLASDGEQNSIFVAEADAGMGVWEINTELTDAELTVLPGTARTGNYEADLTWTLQTTP